MELIITPTGYKFIGSKRDLKSHAEANKGQSVKAFILNNGSELTAGEARNLNAYISERHGELIGK